MTRCVYYLCLSFFIIVLEITYSNCSNETNFPNGSDGYNINVSNSILAEPFVENADNNTETAYTKNVPEFDSMVDIGITNPVEKYQFTTVTPNLEIQSSSTSAVRPTEATTPVPTTDSYAKTENNYENVEYPSVNEKTDIVNLKVEDPNAQEIIKTAGNQIEEALQTQPSTVMQPNQIEQNYVNASVVPVLKVPKPIVIDFESPLPTYDSKASKERDTSTLQEKVETTINKDGQIRELPFTENGLISKKSGTEASLPEPEPTKATITITNMTQLPALILAFSNENTESESSKVGSTSTGTENPTLLQLPETSTINTATATAESTTTTEFPNDSNANTPAISSISISSTKEPSLNNTIMSLAPITSENNSTPMSMVNHTSSTPMSTLETSTPPLISNDDLYGNRNSTVHQFFLDLRTHTILCLISLFIMLLTVATVCSIVLACVLFLQFLWKGLVNVFGMMKKCYVKRKDSSRNVYESGSLFPTRCDVSVRPYLNDHDMY